jgi:putative ABC transport system permease protein
VLLSSIAFLLALILVELGLPTFNVISGKNLLLQSIFANKLALVGLLSGTIFVGTLAGSYPAFFLSAHKPVDTLRGRLGAVSGREALRKGLVIFQFSLAIVLITATVVVYQQLRYLQNQRLGFDKEHVVILPIVEDRNMKFKKDLFKSEMLEHSSILKVTAASHVPGDKIGLRGNDDIDLREYRLEGIPEIFHAAYLDADHDFAATLNLELIVGRWFAKEMATDSSAFVMNEAAARMFGVASPEDILGRRLTRFKRYPESATIHIQGPVIGVVRDFHYASLHENVKPLIFNLTVGRWDANRFAIRIAAEDIRGTLGFLAAKWKTYTKIYPFTYSFLEEKLDALYHSEERLGKIFSIFAGLTILIACLGLFGLAAFTAERRTKEIGIRKVLGATVANLVALLSKDFVKLVVAANLIAWPIAYFAMNKWLQDFAYRIEIGWWMFALAGGMALIIALLTVSTQAIKVALANPVEALRYE